MQYRTISDLSRLIRENIYKIPHDIDLVLGIPRSGMLPASMVALYLNRLMADIDSFIDGRVFNVGYTRKDYLADRKIKKVLVVDDSSYSGTSIDEARQKLRSFEGQYTFLYMAAIVTSAAKEKVDLYCEVIDDSRIFEWNLFHHNFLANACLDIDGVICLDPLIDDDGPEYLHFLHNAKPKFIPTAPVDTLISCRLEKYREQTEAWLKENGVFYNNLVMLDFPDKAARLRWGKHGEYKGLFYKKSNANLFIESSLSQAITIANISHKPVICVETNSLIFEDTDINKCKNQIRGRFPLLYKKCVKIYHRLIK